MNEAAVSALPALASNYGAEERAMHRFFIIPWLRKHTCRRLRFSAGGRVNGRIKPLLHVNEIPWGACSKFARPNWVDWAVTAENLYLSRVFFSFLFFSRGRRNKDWESQKSAICTQANSWWSWRRVIIASITFGVKYLWISIPCDV